MFFFSSFSSFLSFTKKSNGIRYTNESATPWNNILTISHSRSNLRYNGRHRSLLTWLQFALKVWINLVGQQ